MEFRKKRIELKKAADAAGKAGDTGKNI